MVTPGRNHSPPPREWERLRESEGERSKDPPKRSLGEGEGEGEQRETDRKNPIDRWHTQ